MCWHSTVVTELCRRLTSCVFQWNTNKFNSNLQWFILRLCYPRKKKFLKLSAIWDSAVTIKLFIHFLLHTWMRINIFPPAIYIRNQILKHRILWSLTSFNAIIFTSIPISITSKFNRQPLSFLIRFKEILCCCLLDPSHLLFTRHCLVSKVHSLAININLTRKTYLLTYSLHGAESFLRS